MIPYAEETNVSGFCINAKPLPNGSLRLVDVGHSEASGYFDSGSIAAAWAHPNSSRQRTIHRTANRLLLVEGQPDRVPERDEPLEHWLPGRWGSFRGCEIRFDDMPAAAPIVTAFVDPFGSRPLFYSLQSGLCISDKLATIALNCPGLTVRWGPLLESIVLGSLYSHNVTTLNGCEELAPGEVIRFQGNRIDSRRTFPIPGVPDLEPERVRQDAAGSLVRALDMAVQEVWRDRNSWLMLSGGLDSRFVLALGGKARKILTIEYPSWDETSIATHIAEACGSEFQIFSLRPEYLTRIVADGFLITGGSHDSHFVNHITYGYEWRNMGISAVCHAYLFDTLLKGWLIRPTIGSWTDRALAPFAGARTAHLSTLPARTSWLAAHDVISLLSAAGRDVLHEQITNLIQSMEPVIAGSMDLTVEKYILSWISKQVHYASFLGWIEELDVQSPVFHPALWAWYKASLPEHRYGGAALRKALLSTGHAVCSIEDYNTHAPIALVEGRAETAQSSLIRLLASYSRRIGYRLLHPSGQSLPSTPAGTHFRHASRALLDAAVAQLETSPLFDSSAIHRMVKRFYRGDNRYLEPAISVIMTGQWLNWIAHPADWRPERVISFPFPPLAKAAAGIGDYVSSRTPTSDKAVRQAPPTAGMTRRA
jgi:hypothetical protein